MHLQLWPIFLLERRDAFCRVSLDQDRVAPLQHGMTPRRDVLGGVVQWLGAGLVCGVRPMCGEDVVGLASENEVKRPAHRLAHDLAHPLVPIFNRPATVREPATVVLFRSARGLHDPVEGQEGANHQFSHLSCSFLGDSTQDKGVGTRIKRLLGTLPIILNLPQPLYMGRSKKPKGQGWIGDSLLISIMGTILMGTIPYSNSHS